ncbi:MAG: cyclic pyranopterin monophosphate synthase MoaC [Micavibrio sp. TMED2]|nr:MAG: cyclic pyranopterin monophosphate synthase MoaC [Micavibrio sp. TMED2]
MSGQDNKLSHIGADGAARMVDVSDKQVTKRTAIAKGSVRMSADTLKLITDQKISKGNVIDTARLAGIMAAKRTGDLIPLCHPLPLQHVDLDIVPDDALPGLQVTATATITARTGVEMEALTAVSLACLTIYDMVKSADKSLVINDIRLTYKDGGKSGTYRADEA